MSENNKKSSFKSDHDLATMPSTKQSKEDAVLDSVKKDGMALEYADKDMKSNKKIVLAAVKQDGMALQFATQDMKRDKHIVLAAVKQNGNALYYATQDMKGDKDIVLAAVKQNGWALQLTNEDTKGDKDVILAAVKQNGTAFQYANQDIKRDKDIVLAAVNQDWHALEFANNQLKEDKDILLAAVKQKEDVLHGVNKGIKEDKDFVLAAVEQNGLVLRFVSDYLRADKEIVCAAVQNNIDALKFAKGGLNQDDDSWKAAGLWNQKHPATCSASGQQPKLFVLSTRFSLQEDSNSPVTRFTKLLNKSIDAQNKNFEIYPPNKFSKCSCDEKWTRMDWPCRGTDKSCTMTNELKEGKPHDGCCWRFSFRWHLEKAKETNGVMIQVVDFVDKKDSSMIIDHEHILGDGQKIENVMAADVGTKIFRIYQPNISRNHFPVEFRASHINTLLTKIQLWYDDGCKDMTDCEIFFEYWKQL